MKLKIIKQRCSLFDNLRYCYLRKDFRFQMINFFADGIAYQTLSCQIAKFSSELYPTSRGSKRVGNWRKFYLII